MRCLCGGSARLNTDGTLACLSGGCYLHNPLWKPDSRASGMLRSGAQKLRDADKRLDSKHAAASPLHFQNTRVDLSKVKRSSKRA